MATIDGLKQARLEKLNKIKQLGIDPYPAKIKREQTIDQARELIEKQVAVVGRLMAIRGHGKIFFTDIVDESGKIQAVFRVSDITSQTFSLLPLIDVGDFIAVQGKVGKTQAGEISIFVTDFQILSKSIQPLPDKWYGFKDIEERYRKRYLDFILNQDSKKIIKTRSIVIDAIRDFLTDRDFIEIETPTLQPIYGGGFARPFKTHHNELDADLYLRISDEMYLKRLIVGGFEKIFEITKVFRNEGIDYDHNPEFTMFEAQIAFQDYTYGMDIVEEIIEYVAMRVLGKTKFTYQEIEMDVKRPWQRYKFVDAIKKFTGINPLHWKNVDQAKAEIQKLNIPEKEFHKLNKSQSIGECIAFAFEEVVESQLIQPTIIYDYPLEVSPLAKKCEDPRFTQRFELFAFGSELGNNYTELSDPIDLRKRFIEEKKREAAGFAEAHQTDNDYLEAIEHGFPPTCGLGIGVDRLVMLLTNAKSIKEVIPFPTLRPLASDKAKKKAFPLIKSQDQFTKLDREKVKDFIQIDSAVESKFPGMSVGVAIIREVNVKTDSVELEQYKTQVLNNLKNLKNTDIDEIPTILAYRKLFKGFGVDWHSKRPSPDALHRRIAQGKSLYRVNTLVDSYNLAVLESKIGLGAFDLSKIKFPVELRFAKNGEQIYLIGESEPTVLETGELIYSDQDRIVTMDVNYRDNDYTKITTSTKDIILYADGAPGIDPTLVEKGLIKGIELITHFCGGKVEFIGVTSSENTQEKILVGKAESRKKLNLGIDYKKANELLEQYLKDPINRMHSYESEAIMRSLAKYFGEDEEAWGIIGLLHDIDWELTKDNTKQHCIKMVDIIKNTGGTEFLIHTIQSHGYGQGFGDEYYGPPELKGLERKEKIEHALAASETLTGLIIASALVQPDKKLASVKIESLKKKYKNVKFAAGCNRNIIQECEQIGIPLDKFLELGLQALQGIHDKLGM